MSEFPLYPNAVDATDEVVVSLRAENERLTGRAELLAIEVEKQQIELTALRRPVEQSETMEAALTRVDDHGDAWVSHAIRTALDTTARQLRERVEMLEAAQGEIQLLHQELAALNVAVAKANNIQIANELKIAALQSPPQERAEIVERQHTRHEIEREFGQTFGSATADIDTLLGDCAAWRNALGVSQDALSERNRECVELRERCGRLEEALRKISEQLPTVPSAALVVGYKSQQLALRALTASQQHTAGSGDTQDAVPTGRYGIDQGQFLAACEAGNQVFGERNSGGTPE